MATPVDYFTNAAENYIKGDIEKLLEAKLDVAGPLLVVCLNATDVLGGVCYGFQEGNVGSRSVEFMKTHLNLPGDLAEYLYTCVRCGSIHQGMPKIGLHFFVDYAPPLKGTFFVDTNTQQLHMNVAEFARAVVDAISTISKDRARYVHHSPSLKSKDAQAFSNLDLSKLQEVRNLYTAYGNNQTHPSSSLSAYNPPGFNVAPATL